jgi:hypothetical protein
MDKLKSFYTRHEDVIIFGAVIVAINVAVRVAVRTVDAVIG